MDISSADFTFVSALVKREAAIVLEPGKEYLVESRLGPIARAEGLNSVGQLVSTLRAAPQPRIVKQVVEALTTNETSFFRDVEPFEGIRTQIMPRLLQDRATTRSLSIWSAACSTGQEPYSLAMLLKHHFPELTTWKVSIVATDLNQCVLDRAREGRFSQLEVNRGLSAMYLAKYFERRGADWCIKDEIKRWISFQEMNLLTGKPLGFAFDIILIRNVLIYFDVETKRTILERASSVLSSDGVLFLGAAETTLNVTDKYERVALGKGSCYRKKEAL